ncbi:hypothetical protein M9H77_27767 [Catharanthus roseus]|uniref:Uncharacterized protein n=1 Tax=Catharanthus roseus TaxID=4058 RepID=A0ACC0ADT9_CATRO|nr:hypothetical protein M9H77_27767 [Catharanthus roseus]
MGRAVVGNRALVWYLAGIDYEMLELGSITSLYYGIRTLFVESYYCIIKSGWLEIQMIDGTVECRCRHRRQKRKREAEQRTWPQQNTNRPLLHLRTLFLQPSISIPGAQRSSSRTAQQMAHKFNSSPADGPHVLCSSRSTGDDQRAEEGQLQQPNSGPHALCSSWPTRDDQRAEGNQPHQTNSGPRAVVSNVQAQKSGSNQFSTAHG